MTDEELKKKSIRFNRVALLIALLLVTGSIVLAILKDSDWWALGGCAALALVLTIFGTDEKNPGKLRGCGVLTALIFFFLYMAIKYLILSI